MLSGRLDKEGEELGVEWVTIRSEGPEAKPALPGPQLAATGAGITDWANAQGTLDIGSP